MPTRNAIGLVPALVLLTGCSASFPTQPSTPAPLVNIRLRFSSICTRLMAGNVVSLDAYAVDADGVYQNVTGQVSWGSSNPNVASANSGTGTTFLAAGGTTDIRATYRNVAGTLTLNVAPQAFPYLQITLSGSLPTARAQVNPGPTLANVGADVTAAATWSSSDSDVATVDGPRVSFGAPGNVEIRASANGISGACWMAVPPRLR